MRFLEDEWHFQSLLDTCKRMLFQLFLFFFLFLMKGSTLASFQFLLFSTSPCQVEENNYKVNFSNSGIFSCGWFFHFHKWIIFIFLAISFSFSKVLLQSLFIIPVDYISLLTFTKVYSYLSYSLLLGFHQGTL